MRIISKSASESLEEANLHNQTSNVVRYLNRDHVVSASVGTNRMVITTSLGEDIAIDGEQARITALIETLVGDVQSNFIQILTKTAI